MAIPPNTELKHVSKAYLNQKFDEAWESSLKNLTPRSNSTLAGKGHCLPKGSAIITSIFVGADGFDLAITYRHVAKNGAILGSREHTPSGMMIDGKWCYTMHSDPPEQP